MNKVKKDARLVANYEVYANQTLLVNDLLKNGTITWDKVYSRRSGNDRKTEIFEWWLVSNDLARMLKDQEEIVIEQYSCNWWGRTTTGQAVHMDEVFKEVAASYFPEPKDNPTRPGARG